MRAEIALTTSVRELYVKKNGRFCKKQFVLGAAFLLVYYYLVYRTTVRIGTEELTQERRVPADKADNLEESGEGAAILEQPLLDRADPDPPAHTTLPDNRLKLVPTSANPQPPGQQQQQNNHKPITKRKPHRKQQEPPKSLPDPSQCKEWFHETLQENLNTIENYPKGTAEEYMMKIGGDLDEPKTMAQFPVVITAANSHYYEVTKALLKSVHEKLMPTYADVKIIYYDLGLQPKQAAQLEKHCKCEVRKFPFEEFPDYVKKLKLYAWKPIIIQKSLVEFGFVWWLDSSVRFTTAQLGRGIDYAKRHGMLFFTYGQVLSVAQHTDSQTMQYLGEDVCKFRQFGETEATFGAYYFNNVTKIAVRAWATCALNQNCIAPPGTEAKLHCNQMDPRDGRCHRFDQAILSILTRRLFHTKNDYPDVDEPIRIHVIQRGHRIKYFPDD